MKAGILTVGDEILLGHIVNTNGAYLADELSRRGFSVERIATVPDRDRAIQSELARQWEDLDLVVISGGLGPTADDRTRDAVANFFGRTQHVNEHVYSRLKDFYAKRGRIAPGSARELSRVPEGFEVLINAVGTAPGLWWEEKGCMLAILPGVPNELKTMVREQLGPKLSDRGGGQVIEQRIIRTVGVPESELVERLEGLDLPENIGFRPDAGEVSIRLVVSGHDQVRVKEQLDVVERKLRERLGSIIYGTDEDTLESRLGMLLKAHDETIAVAESCTGGLVMDRLTDPSGASNYLLGGIVAYDNRIKEQLLNVEDDILASEGAVSGQVARQMAVGVRQSIGASIGVATTGIAGPSGGTPEKPVGTLWLGYADGNGARAIHRQLGGGRRENKERAATLALDLVRRRILEAEGEKV